MFIALLINVFVACVVVCECGVVLLCCAVLCWFCFVDYRDVFFLFCVSVVVGVWLSYVLFRVVLCCCVMRCVVLLVFVLCQCVCECAVCVVVLCGVVLLFKVVYLVFAFCFVYL